MLTCCQILLQIGKATTKAGSVLAQVAVHGGKEVSCVTAPSCDICTTLLWPWPAELLCAAWYFRLRPGVVSCNAVC